MEFYIDCHVPIHTNSKVIPLLQEPPSSHHAINLSPQQHQDSTPVTPQQSQTDHVTTKPAPAEPSTRSQVPISGIEIVLPISPAQGTPIQNPPINIHRMDTRSKIVTLKPTSYLYVSHTDKDFRFSIPKTTNQALKIPHWKNAMDKEYHALLKNQT
ncbi:hypothetical protein PIB30_042217 [Stylosanthes scabra]|uniref:Reverse transcriptase domain-containing protein n=1 Tax=Stylosanthes scabra TaxID=79078 RepID=A0ABU6WIN0_9FABA|nr:hypothetical protein [Stylosanthes scabra]